MSKLLFYNGEILTQDKSLPTVEAILVNNDKIEEVGTETELRELAGNDAEEIDLAGRTLIPGLNDAHIHVWKVGH